MADKIGPPRVVIEHLYAAGHEVVRVVAWSHNEMEAHVIATSLAHAGCAVWIADLWGDEDGSSIERVVGGAGAALLTEVGTDPTGRGAGDELTEREAVRRGERGVDRCRHCGRDQADPPLDEVLGNVPGATRRTATTEGRPTDGRSGA